MGDLSLFLSLSFLTWFFTLVCRRSVDRPRLPLSSTHGSFLSFCSHPMLCVFVPSPVVDCRPSSFSLSLWCIDLPIPLPLVIRTLTTSLIATRSSATFPVRHSLESPSWASCSCRQSAIPWWWNPRPCPVTWTNWTLAWPCGGAWYEPSWNKGWLRIV